MRAFGIVAEFNPFHQGHRYVIEQGRILTECDVCVCVMSGNFVQRGGPAVFDKWERAETAVRWGADLVIELPVIYASSSAEIFAEGAVRTLHGMGGIDFLVFGSESGDTDGLLRAAETLLLRQGEVNLRMRKALEEGLPYHIAAAEARREAGIAPELSARPNDILALEYLKTLILLREACPEREMKPTAVKRTGEGHHKSASRIREDMRKREGSRMDAMEENYWNLVRGKIFTATAESLENISSAGEGLGNKLKKEIRMASSLDDFIKRVKSKRYPYTRISRLAAQTLLDIRKGDAEGYATYVRPLAMTEQGGKFLRYIKKNNLSDIPFIDRIGRGDLYQENVEKVLRKDVEASDIYNLISGRDIYLNSDFVKKTTIFKGG